MWVALLPEGFIWLVDGRGTEVLWLVPAVLLGFEGCSGVLVLPAVPELPMMVSWLEAKSSSSNSGDVASVLSILSILKRVYTN